MMEEKDETPETVALEDKTVVGYQIGHERLLRNKMSVHKDADSKMSNGRA